MALCLLSCSHSGQDDPFIPGSSESGIAFGGNSGNWQEAGSRTGAQTGSRTGEGETGLETLFSSFRVWGFKTKTDALREGGNGTDGHQEDGNGTAAIQKVMEGYLVDWDQNKGWEYIGKQNTFLNTTQTIKYWDYSASSYRFMAYAYNDETKEVTASTDANLSKTTFSIPYAFSNDATSTTTPYISELWVSNNQSTGQNKYGDQVKLTFAPLIAKVRFKFKYAEGQVPQITDISFKDSRWQKDATGKNWQWTAANEAKTPIEGTIVISYPLSETNKQVTKSWENTKVGPLELTIPYEEKDDAIHQTKTYQKWYYMPPMDIAKYTQGTYIITANVNGNPVSATVDSKYTQWEAGCQYTYTFKISETNTSISFAEVQVEQWKENGVLDNNGNGTKDW